MPCRRSWVRVPSSALETALRRGFRVLGRDRAVGALALGLRRGPQLLEQDHLASINPCLLHSEINQGDTIRLSARYDNSQPYQDVMGINLSYVWWGEQ